MPQSLNKSTLSIPLELKVSGEGEAGTYAGRIVKLTLQGFLAEIASTVIQTGERFEATFAPGATTLSESITIVKIYSQWSSAPTVAPGTVLRLIEAHFTALTPKTRTSLTTYLAATQNPDKQK